MARRKLVYEGKAKILYEGPKPGTLVQYFKDDATAFNAEKKDVIDGKGALNNILSLIFGCKYTNGNFKNKKSFHSFNNKLILECSVKNLYYFCFLKQSLWI